MASFDELFNAVKQAQNRGGGVREATSGFSDQLQTGTANRQARLKAELEKMTLHSNIASKKADDTRADADLRLKFANSKKTSTLTNAEGKTVGTLPGLDPGADYIPGQGAVGLGGPVPTAPKVLPKDGNGTAADPKSLISTLDTMEKILQTSPSGPVAGRVAGAVGSVTGGGMQTNTKLYNDMLPATAVGIYRAVTKDTRLSDADAQARAIPIMPKPSEDPALQAKKIAFLRSALSSGQTMTPEQFTASLASIVGPSEPTSAQPAQSGAAGELVHTYPSGRKARYNPQTKQWEPLDVR